MYADYEYYTACYLIGRHPVLSEDEFPFWEKLAEREVDRHTYCRIEKDVALCTDYVKDCVCAIAEVLYKADQIQAAVSDSGIAGVVTSYSNDGESATLDVSQSIYTTEGKQREIKRLVRLYLQGTKLLYAGVIQCES